MLNIGFLKEISPIMIEYHDSKYLRPIPLINKDRIVNNIKKLLYTTNFYEEIYQTDELEDLFQEINTYIWDGCRKNLHENYLIKNILLYILQIEEQFNNPKYSLTNHKELITDQDKQEYIDQCIDLEKISDYLDLNLLVEKEMPAPRVIEILELKESNNPWNLLSEPHIIIKSHK